VTFGSFAFEFIKAHVRNDQDALKKWRTSWCALPWAAFVQQRQSDRVSAKCGGYEWGTVPLPPIALLLTADFGEKKIWWTVTAICIDKGNSAGSYLIDYGHVPTLDELVKVSERIYSNFPITATAVDCGYDTPHVKDFCLQHGWLPVRGETKIHGMSFLNKETGLLNLNVDILKNILADKIDAPQGKWWVYQDCSEHPLTEFFVQMGAEHRVMVTKDGFARWKWKKPRKNNHLWDCCVYAEGLSQYWGLRFGKPLSPIFTPQDGEQPKQQKKDDEPELDGHFDRLEKYSRWHR
jgi:phage terminase large subunit GpA-like protein